MRRLGASLTNLCLPRHPPLDPTICYNPLDALPWSNATLLVSVKLSLPGGWVLGRTVGTPYAGCYLARFHA